MPLISIAGFISTERSMADTTLIIRAVKSCRVWLRGAPAAGNSVRSARLDTTFISGVSQLVHFFRFSTLSYISTDLTNKVHCSHYKSTRIRKPLLKQALAYGLLTPFILAKCRYFLL